MIISDLNYLENTSEEVIGGGVAISPNFSEIFTINKSITSTVSIVGFTATSQSTADATGGKGGVTQVFTATYTDGNSASSAGTSVSATAK